MACALARTVCQVADRRAVLELLQLSLRGTQAYLGLTHRQIEVGRIKLGDHLPAHQ